MEVVRYDHVVAAVARAHVPARIGGDDVKARALLRAGGRPAREVRRCGDHFGQQLDRVDLQRLILGRGRRRHAGAQPQEQDALGCWVQQQRQPRLPGVHAQAGVAALLLPVVDAQAGDAFPIFDHADGGHHALLVADDVAARGDIDERQRRREKRDRHRDVDAR